MTAAHAKSGSRAWAWAWLRLASLTCGLAVLAAIGLAAAVRARIDAWTDDLGETLMRIEPSRDGRTATSMQLNGLSLRLSTTTSSDSVLETLASFEAECRRLGAASFVELDATPTRLPDAILSARGADVAAAACLVPTSGQRSLASFVAAAHEFAKDLDLAVFGSLRYMRAERTPRGSLLLMLSTHGALPLRRAFPTEADAPGADPLELPRPARSRRILSGVVGAEQASVHVYRAEARDIESFVRAYEADLRERGLFVTHNADDTTAPSQVVLTARNASFLTQISVVRESDHELVVAMQRTR